MFFWLSPAPHGSPPFQRSSLSQLSDIKCKELVNLRLWKAFGVCQRLLLQIRAMHLFAEQTPENAFI